MVAEDIDIFARDYHHLLLLAELHDGLELISQSRGSFKPKLIRSLVHSTLEVSLQILSFTLQQQSNVSHCFIVLFRRAKTADTGSKTAFDVIFKTRPVRFAVDL